MQKDSKQVRLFLADGTVGGLITAEIMNWTGHVLKGKRMELGEIVRRPEAARSGVYILFGTGEEDEKIAYIGESDRIIKRLEHHVRDKDYWDEVVIITSKDANLTSAHVRYLESKLVALAKGIGRYDLKNVQVPSGGADLPEADQSDMNYFIRQLRILLPVLGYDIFRGRTPEPVVAEESAARIGETAVAETADATDSPPFKLKTGTGVDATLQVIDSEFTVLAGSVVRAAMRDVHAGLSKATQRQHMGRSRLHEALMRDAEINDDRVTATLVRDHVFTSVSAAAAVVQGSPTANGRIGWKRESGETFGEWEESRAEVAAIS